RTATLLLEDGRVFRGTGYGFEGEAVGEVVFNTSMTGYQEILTDPSYAGQIVTMTYPLIGNTGINPEDVESRKPFLEAFIVKRLSPVPTNGPATGEQTKAWRITSPRTVFRFYPTSTHARSSVTFA